MSSERKLYWDSDVCIDLLEQTPARIHRLLPIIAAARNGQLVIVTSALTMAEVSKLKNLNLIDELKEKLITEFFENDYFSIRNVDRFVAEKARAIARKCGVKPPDAIQIATAILMEVEVMHTFDGKVLGLSGLVEVEELKIEEPPEPS